MHLHFNKYGPKGQYPSQQDYGPGLHEPLLLGDRSRNGVDATGIVGLTRDVTTQNGTHHRQREDHKQTDTGNRHLQTKQVCVYGAHVYTA